jgi:hypothetical protein
MVSETTSIYPTAHRRRANRFAAGPSLRPSRHPSPLPDPPGQRARAPALSDRPANRRLQFGRPRCPARLRRRGDGLRSPHVQGSQDRSCGLAERSRRRPARPAAPVASDPRQVDPSRDARFGCPGLPREGLDFPIAPRRDHSPDPGPVGRRREAGQALAGQPRPGVRAKKNAATP